MSEPEESHLIRQAEVPPLDVDGAQAATLGSALFAIATVIMALCYDRLTANGDGWWLGVGIGGLTLGLLGLGYTLLRRRGRRRRANSGTATN
ncbi:MAG: DUF2530 domain-containing protein [Microlunatus sp.]